jgi:large subunit ribosomal protein L14e
MGMAAVLTGLVPVALSSADIANKFAASAWGKKLAARQAKANMTDLDRYKAMVAKCKRSRLVRTAFNKLKKSA